MTTVDTPAWSRHIKDVAGTLRAAKKGGRSSALLIGAGCSVKGGIPVATGVIEYIRSEYGEAYERARDKTYPHCMDELSLSERRDVIAHFVDDATINWAHVCIAQLIRAGYVDRVLTTNFDPLLIRACSLLGEFPAVYDFASSQIFKPADIPDKAIVYLHGQRTGFVLLNTSGETDEQSAKLAPVFEEAGMGRVWLVVGYSGENDPVFERLASIPRFDNTLYWIGYRDAEPATHVRERLLEQRKDAYYIKGFDADDFFVTLAQELECFPPTFVDRPFEYLEQLLTTLSPYSPPAGRSESPSGGGYDLMEGVRKFLHSAGERYEEAAEAGTRAKSLLLAGSYDDVIAMRPLYDASPTADLGESLAWAYLSQGTEIAGRARDAGAEEQEESERLFEEAYGRFRNALEVQPDKTEALRQFADAQGDQAKKHGGSERARRLYSQAYDLYKQALDADPSMHMALRNWAITLEDEASAVGGDEARALREQAVTMMQRAGELGMNDAGALLSWANSLSEIDGPGRDERLLEANELYERALALDPNQTGILASSAANLIQLARAGKRDTPTSYAEARERLQRAETARPGVAAYNLACLAALEGDEPGCERWLKVAQEAGELPDRAFLDSDADLDSVRETGWFKELRAQADPPADDS